MMEKGRCDVGGRKRKYLLLKESEDNLNTKEEEEEDIREKEEYSRQPKELKKSPKQFDIPNLLSSSCRDYLIKNNGDKIRIKEVISGKRVVLFIWKIRDNGILPQTFDAYFYQDLKEIYEEYNPRGQFEIVMVVVGYNEKVFNDAFSAWPWLAVPHEDQECRDLIDKTIEIEESFIGKSVLFDLDGTILLDECTCNFRNFGPEGFPFTKEKLAEIEHEDKALLEEIMSSESRPPLRKLLGEFVYSSEGKRVSTSELENHIVGVHCFDGLRFDKPSTKRLLDAWKLLKDDRNK